MIKHSVLIAGLLLGFWGSVTQAADGRFDLLSTRPTSQPAASPAASSSTTERQPAVAAMPAESSPAPVAAQANDVPPPPTETVWVINRTDTALAQALRRWAKTAGYDLVWDAQKEAPAFPMRTTGTFRSALEQTMKDSVTFEYPLRACIYKNHVVRIIHRSELCKQIDE